MDAHRRMVLNTVLFGRAGTGDPGEEAFYRVAEEGLVSYDPAKIHWRAYTVRVRAKTM